MAGRKLVIVESPAKARTIAGYLGKDFDVEASVGHIRDLPQPSELPAEMKKGPYKKFAVDVENGFDPYYVVYPDKKKKVAELKKLLKDADELYLATDEDREGEAIAWHLLETLKPKVPVKRMVFHEITREAIERALGATRDIDDRLVDAQETRRILDRLYGYEISPVLWRKVRQGLSAGRVQSVATRMVVDRERERMAFVKASYWDLRGQFSHDGSPTFPARLMTLDGVKVAQGRDFADDGSLKAKNAVALDEQAATSLVSALQEAAFAVRSVETKPYTRRPAAPFTTSTLQQEASRKLRWSSNQTMRTAQGLYENGYITYMRTDSSALSSQAIAAARRQATELYGADFIPEKPRFYGKAAKGAQEAHEAIRPAGDSFRTPGQVSRELSGDQFKLYELIWKRTVASQMADAKGSTATIRLGATAATGQDAEFGASGTVITFRGFLAAYEEGRDVERYGDASDKETRLPDVAEGAPLTAEDLAAEGHETSPPPRYTEASLVKALEERGIGRPSTYASTISTITDRGYVDRRGQALVPTWLAFAVTRLIEENYARLIDYDFTAGMEADLDSIAQGERDRVDWLTGFYFGRDGDEGLKDMVADAAEIDARQVNSIPLGDDIVLRVGRYGPYLESAVPAPEGETPKRASVPEELAPDELTPERARELMEQAATTGDDGRPLGTDPESGHEIVVKNGRFGPYVTEILPEPTEGEAEKPKKGKGKAAKPKPRTASLFKDMSVESVDLEAALKLLSLPRVVGTVTEGEGDEAKQVDITAQNGRYGPYLKKGTDSRSLETEQQLFDITLEQALAIYAQPKRGRGAGTAKPPLAEFGEDPVSGKPVVVKDGRFGAYVTDGTTNATLRKGDPLETLTKERAYEILAEKRAAGPAKRPARGAKRTSTKSRSKA
ncbi:type I DNA topoisomerase [Pseudactinotalea sp.]|uniref:type I DNA topoisomerase n=1 Tax=Pseudactinotalea sp. TaxID=1926260 RepID=UPI003B3AE107